MATTAPQIAYRQEIVAGFEQTKPIFRIGANTAYNKTPGASSVMFVVADSGGARASTRGSNGLIPASAMNLTQIPCPLVEKHHKVTQSDFDVFVAQGDVRRRAQADVIATLNREIDILAIEALNTASLTTGSATAMTLALLLKAQAMLGNNDVPVDESDSVFCVITPGAHAALMQIPSFSSADFNSYKPFAESKRIMFKWMGITFMVSTLLPGQASVNETLFMWHKDSLGVAADSESATVVGGLNEEHKYYYNMASMYIGTKLLQNKGVIKIPHNATGFF